MELQAVLDTDRADLRFEELGAGIGDGWRRQQRNGERGRQQAGEVQATTSCRRGVVARWVYLNDNTGVRGRPVGTPTDDRSASTPSSVSDREVGGNNRIASFIA